MRLLATVEYDGTAFAGFQLQAPAGPGRPLPRTVQGVLEGALAPLTPPPPHAPPRVVAAGRTDAGVHAAGQVVHLDTAAPLAADPDRFLRAWNARLPEDCAVRALRHVPAGFHARYSACSRTYAYRVVNAPTPAPLLARYAHHVRNPLDLPAMAAAAAHLLGTHDFAPFAGAPGPGSTLREVIRVDVREEWVAPLAIWHTLSQEAQPRAAPRAPLTSYGTRVVVLEVEANAFLRHMMRRIAGTLVEVGLGARPPDGVAAVLAGRDGGRAGDTAPARGLCLQHVRYPADRLAGPAGAAGDSTARATAQ